MIFYLVVIVKTPSSAAYPILLIGCVLSVQQPKQMLHIFDFNLLVDTRKTLDDLEIPILILQGESHAETRWCWNLHGASSAPTSGLH